MQPGQGEHVVAVIRSQNSSGGATDGASLCPATGYALTRSLGFVASSSEGPRPCGGPHLASAVAPSSRARDRPLALSRLVVGLGEGFASAVTDLLATYVPKKLRARSVTTVFGGMELGNALGLLICGPLIEKSGWSSVFYIFAALGFVWCAFWPIFSPTKLAANVDDDMVEEIMQKKKAKKSSKIPYGEFFKSSAVWAVVTAHFCHNWGYYTLLAWLPSYFESVLQLNLTGAARMSLVPYLAMACMIPVVGAVADGLQEVQHHQRQEGRTGSGFVGPAICMVVCGF